MVWQWCHSCDMGYPHSPCRAFWRYTTVSLCAACGKSCHFILFHRYSYAGTTFAITEIDGVRVISSDVCDLIQKVPGNSFSSCYTTSIHQLILLHSVVSVDFSAGVYIAFSYSLWCMGELLSSFSQGRRKHPKYSPRSCSGRGRVYWCRREGVGAILATAVAQCMFPLPFVCGLLTHVTSNIGRQVWLGILRSL